MVVTMNRGLGGALIIFGFVLSSCMAECPTRNDVVPLDSNKFAGEWFVVAGTPTNGKSLSKCGRFVVMSRILDSLVMNYTAVSHIRNSPVAFIVNARLDEDVTGNWQLRGSNRVLGPYKHRVLEVNYDSYFAMIACADDSAIVPVREFSMIWSRGRSLSSTILDRLKNKVASYIDRDKILDVDHSSC